jgi:uncharacterized protein YdaU (DUF1376 family)
MSQMHYLPMFFGDLLASTPTWDGEERALYMLLLAYQWTAGPLPTDVRRLSKMCQYEHKTFIKLWETVGKKFIEKDSGLINVRLEEHRDRSSEIANKRAKAGAEGAAKRWQKPQTQDGNEMANAIANAKDLSCHPIQSNPIQSQEEDSRRGEAPSVDKAIYADARIIFGKSIGGQIGKAIKLRGKPWLLGILEACRTKDQEQARAYLAAAMNGVSKPDDAALRREIP